MHTIEAAVILPIIFFFAIGFISISLRYTEILSKHTENVSNEMRQHSVSNADIARGGDIIYEIYREIKG